MGKSRAADKDWIVVDLELAKKVWSVVSKGLTSGIGDPRPGHMCVEAAVCYALGLPHSDNPPCVGAYIRSNKIELNDCRWSSNKARGQGLLRVAIAQLGSNKISQSKYRSAVLRLLAQRLVAPAVRKYAVASAKATDNERTGLVDAADRLDALTPASDTRPIKAALRAALRLSEKHSSRCRNYWPYEDLPTYEEAAYDLYRVISFALDESFDTVKLIESASTGTETAKDAGLIAVAEIILDALRECDSPGVKLLDEIEAEVESA